MPPHALVTLRFGPYRSCGVLEHRPFRLQGLQVLLNLSQHCTMRCNKLVPSYFVKAGGQHGSVCSEWISNRVLEKHTEDMFAVLQAEGHQLILEKIPDWNNVELIVNGETVFQCNINDLDFGGDGKLDPLCEEARIAVLNAY